jgi:hypothetical protein
MKNSSRFPWLAVLILVAALAIGQVFSYFVSPSAWQAYLGRLPAILSMVAFWGPIVAILTGIIMWLALRLAGFSSLEEIRSESVEQNNPAPAIILVGTLIATLLFLLIVIRP